MLLTGKLFVEEDDKVSVSFFQKLLEKQMKELKLEGDHQNDRCQLKFDQPLKKREKYQLKSNSYAMV